MKTTNDRVDVEQLLIDLVNARELRKLRRREIDSGPECEHVSLDDTDRCWEIDQELEPCEACKARYARREIWRNESKIAGAALRRVIAEGKKLRKQRLEISPEFCE